MIVPPTKTAVRTLGLLLSAALVAGACGSDPQVAESSEAATAAPATTQGSEEPSASSEESPAPSEESPQAGSTEVLSTISGGQIDFGSLQGQDVLLWFWAPW